MVTVFLVPRSHCHQHHASPINASCLTAQGRLISKNPPPSLPQATSVMPVMRVLVALTNMPTPSCAAPEDLVAIWTPDRSLAMRDRQCCAVASDEGKTLRQQLLGQTRLEVGVDVRVPKLMVESEMLLSGFERGRTGLWYGYIQFRSWGVDG